MPLILTTHENELQKPSHPMLIDILKKSFLFQNAASFVASRIPSMVEHNVQKYAALKKAFYLTALEQLEGDYLEFGVFTGSSFVCAMRVHRTLQFLSRARTRFFGFDSFSGFGDVQDHDRHPFYLDSFFAIDASKVIANIQRRAKGLDVQVVQGFFEDTLKGKDATVDGVRQARIVFIDCDLKEPARLALDYVRPTLQPGTILLMDDFFSYRGDEKKGVAGAFEEFCAAHPELRWRRLYDYGYGGIAFIVSGAGLVS